RVIQPANEDRIGPSKQPTHIAVSPPAPVPLLVELAPLRIVAITWVVRRLGVCHVQRPSVRGVLKDVSLHGNVDSGRASGRRRNGLERRWQPLGSGPRHEAAITLAVHSHATVAPWLLGNPIDYSARIVAVVLVRGDFRGALAISARISHYPHIAVCRALPGVVLRLVDRELEKCGSRVGGAPRANHHLGDARSFR